MEDGPEVNRTAEVSRALGVVAFLLILVGTLIILFDSIFNDLVVLCFPGLLFSLMAIIGGSIAAKQIRDSAGSQRGSKIAWAGIILGAISILLLCVAFFYVIYFEGGFV